MKPSPFTVILAHALFLTLIAPAAQASESTARQTILDGYAQAAGGGAFSAERGKTFFETAHSGGKPETPSCSTCHTKNPLQQGQTRAGKVIEPMAASKTPSRFTDPAKVEKWFGRNCDTVLGRPCTPAEKGDFLTYLSSL